MRVHGEQEDDVEIVGIDESFVGLLADTWVCGAVDEELAEEHDVTGDATSLGEEDLERGGWAEEGAFDVEEAAREILVCADFTSYSNNTASNSCLLVQAISAFTFVPAETISNAHHTIKSKLKSKREHSLNIMPCRMQHTPKRQTHSNIPMKHDRLIQRHPSHLRSHPRHEMSAHWQENQGDVECEC